MDKYEKWSCIKRETNIVRRKITLRPREIWWVKIGYNIGTEEYGKGKDFCRPVIVIRRLTSDIFIGIPLTTKVKESNDYFHIFEFNTKTGNKKNSAMILQIRSFSIKRVINKLGIINREDFQKIVEKTINIVTPPNN